MSDTIDKAQAAAKEIIDRFRDTGPDGVATILMTTGSAFWLGAIAAVIKRHFEEPKEAIKLYVGPYNRHRDYHICRDDEGHEWKADLLVDGTLNEMPPEDLVGKVVEVDRFEPWFVLATGTRIVADEHAVSIRHDWVGYPAEEIGT